MLFLNAKSVICYGSNGKQYTNTSILLYVSYRRFIEANSQTQVKGHFTDLEILKLLIYQGLIFWGAGKGTDSFLRGGGGD